MRGLSTSFFAGCGLTLVALVALVASTGRWRLVRDTITAAALTVVAGLVLARWISGDWPDVLPEITLGGDPPAYPGLRIALIVAVFGTVHPSLTVPMRRLARWIAGLTALSALVAGYATPWGVLGGCALGFGVAAAVRLWFGTSNGVPSLDRVGAALADLGLDVDELHYPDQQPQGSLWALGRDADGELSVRVYGRDAADSAFARRLWHAMWYRNAAWSMGVSRQQLAEHEALLLLLARRADLHVPEVVAVGGTSTGDVVLATRVDHSRRPIADLPPAQLDDDALDSLWAELARLHAAGLTHGGLSPATITVADGRRPGFVDLEAGSMSPDDAERHADLFELLVTTSLLAGTERAVDSMVRCVDAGDLTAALGSMQSAVMSRPLARRARDAELDVDELRHAVADALDVETPEPVDLKRVRWSDVAMLVLALFAANALIGWITNIDLDTFVDELAGASIGWLVVALVLSQLTNVAETVSMMGVVSRPLPFGPTMQFQYATSYIGLAVPSDAGRIAMTIRYLQKLGVPTRIAVGQGPFTTVFGYLIDLVLLLVTMQVVGTSLELPDDTDFSGFVTLLIVLVVVVVVGVVVVLAIPKLRKRIVPAVAETVSELKGSLTDPSRAAKLLGGLLAKKLLFAMTLASILAAFDQPLPLAAVVFVNTAVSWFAGVFPVPGGIGVAEAGFVVGLTAFGVSESVALATALAHRLLTTYLPPVVGFFAMKRMERDGFL
jgi:uncharacterized membrane protein YbhN (UPF0104 family)/tRNA A-37 threonylcarbamoyl transferase component Bud32